MLTFKQHLLAEDKYVNSGIDTTTVKHKVKYHRDEASKLSKELTKHNKTSKEYRHINNDITHHHNAANSYDEANYRIKNSWAPSDVKAKIKSGENHASKVSGKIPAPAKKSAKIKNIHDHVHGMLTGQGFKHEKTSHDETTHSLKRMTPYGDDRQFAQRGKRTNTIHSYTKSGSKEDAKHIERSLKKDNVLGTRGNHHIYVQHKGNTVTVTHHVTGTSKPDHSYNERQYNYNTGAHNDPEHWGTRYHSWRKMK